MTIGIALKYGTGIVLGSDAQATADGISYKESTTKLTQIGNNVGLVGAEDTNAYRELVRKLRPRRKDVDQSDVPAVAEMVADTMAGIYKSVAARLGYADVQEAVPLAPMDLLLAGLDKDGDRHIFRITPPGVIGYRDDFSAIGSIAYAGMSLKRGMGIFLSEGYGWDDAARLVVRTIMETGEMDPYVGGVQLAVIDTNSIHYPQRLLKEPPSSPYQRVGRLLISRFTDEIEAENTAISVLFGAIRPDAVDTNAETKRLAKILHDAGPQFREAYATFLKGT